MPCSEVLVFIHLSRVRLKTYHLDRSSCRGKGAFPIFAQMR